MLSRWYRCSQAEEQFPHWKERKQYSSFRCIFEYRKSTEKAVAKITDKDFICDGHRILGCARSNATSRSHVHQPARITSVRHRHALDRITVTSLWYEFASQVLDAMTKDVSSFGWLLSRVFTGNSMPGVPFGLC
jgi:hypothetical protein